MKFSIILLAAAAIAVPAHATSGPEPEHKDHATAVAGTSSEKLEDASVEAKSDEVVCVTDKVVGSRLKARKVCKTRKQWDEEAALNRQEVEKIQAGRYKNN